MDPKTKMFVLTRGGKEVGVVTITGADIAGAEQNIVILDSDGKAAAVVEMQPGVDRREISS